jgi:hypothetical protein
MRKLARVAMAACLVGGVVVLGSAPSGAVTESVDIRVEHDVLPGSPGPRVFEVIGVTPGPGIEVDDSDEVSNPAPWGNGSSVDIDPDADTITVAHIGGLTCYDSITVEITTSQIASVEVVSDALYRPDEPVALTTSVVGGVVTLAWLADDVNGTCPLLDTGGTAVFSYTLVQPTEPTASLSPAAVAAGDPVTVTGNLCPSGPVMATIAPEGGTPIVDDEEQTVADEAGDWSFEIDTTNLAPGTYTAAIRCVQADLAGFDYEVLSFTVTVAAPPAEPAPAAPTFTG